LFYLGFDLLNLELGASAPFGELRVLLQSQPGRGAGIPEPPAVTQISLRPAIIDLDVTAPDTMSAGHSRTFTNSAGATTLFVELFDSVSGEILARAVDREETRQNSTFRYTTRSSNKADATRMLARWADLLRDRLDHMRAVD